MAIPDFQSSRFCPPLGETEKSAPIPNSQIAWRNISASVSTKNAGPYRFVAESQYCRAAWRGFSFVPALDMKSGAAGDPLVARQICQCAISVFGDNETANTGH